MARSASSVTGDCLFVGSNTKRRFGFGTGAASKTKAFVIQASRRIAAHSAAIGGQSVSLLPPNKRAYFSAAGTCIEPDFTLIIDYRDAASGGIVQGNVEVRIAYDGT